MEQKTTEITIEQAQQLRSNCKEAIALAESLERLHNNADFKAVFLDEFITKTPARLVGLLADASINMGTKKNEHREDLQERMIGIARLSEYMRNVFNMANQATKTLSDLNEVIME